MTCLPALHGRPATALTNTHTNTDANSNANSDCRHHPTGYNSPDSAPDFRPNPGPTSDSKRRPGAALLRGGDQPILPVAEHADLRTSCDRATTRTAGGRRAAPDPRPDRGAVQRHARDHARPQIQARDQSIGVVLARPHYSLHLAYAN